MTIIADPQGQSIAFTGHYFTVAAERVNYKNSGSWMYKGVESSTGKRLYDLSWNHTGIDAVALSEDGRKLNGFNRAGLGPCHVQGTRR